MNANFLAATTLVESLAQGGLQHVCIAPGSRSTPLTLAFAAHPSIQTHVHLDERSAAFFALGLAMSTRKPVALVCTSGSAAANFFPAIVEAHMSRVPLIVLTADRPHELRHSGANQTIDQVKLYGDFALWAVDMAVPEATPNDLALRNVRTTATRALAIANGARAGVVHLNLPFRKPLEPTAQEYADWVEAQKTRTPSLSPATRIERGATLPTPAQMQDLRDLVEAHPRGVIVCGPRCEGDAFADAVLALSAHIGYPVLADPLSGVRFGHANAISAYDTMLALDKDIAAPDMVIRFGDVPTSAALCDWLSKADIAHRVHIAPGGQWADDDHRVTWLLQADAVEVCAALMKCTPQLESDWYTQWLQRDQTWRAKTMTTLQKRESESEAYFDGEAIAQVLNAIPENANVFVGNSLAVRHVDQFGVLPAKPLTVWGSRGASGIDGNVSTALGIAAAQPDKPMIALMGDVTLYHDMNGLLAIRRNGIANATFVVMNNNGGGIFRRLPVAQIESVFEPYFLTPPGLDMAHIAQLYGLRHTRIQTRRQLQAGLVSPTFADGGQLIEIQTNSMEDLKQRKAFLEFIQH